MAQFEGKTGKVYSGSPTPNKTESTTPTGTDIRHVNAQCKIVIYEWNRKRLEIDGQSNDTLSQTTKLDVSSRLLDCTFSKSMSNPSGFFSFSLGMNTGLKNRTDWKDIIKPGTWCLIYMSQDGDLNISPEVDKVLPTPTNKLRCMGLIDYPAVRQTTDSKGAQDWIFEVSGRDFGAIYEDTAIWHNLFNYEKTALDALKGGKLKVTGSAKINEIIELVHNLFFKPEVSYSGLAENESLTELAKQWLLPTNLLNDLNIKRPGASYYGNIPDLLDISKTSATISVSQPLDYLSGGAWQSLKKLSIPEFHELFCELNDTGQPKLIFRPIPWSIDQSKYPEIAVNITKYKDLKPRIYLNTLDIEGYKVGENNHNRKNHFLLNIRSSLWNAIDNITHLKSTRFPLQIKDSVTRHGFKPLHVDIDSLALNEMLNDGKPNHNRVKEYNELMVDYWNNAIYFESGTVEIIGNNNIKVGRTIETGPDVAYIGEKIFYIEEYEDVFTIDEKGVGKWMQSVSITRGAEKVDLISENGFEKRNVKFVKFGDFNE